MIDIQLPNLKGIDLESKLGKAMKRKLKVIMFRSGGYGRKVVQSSIRKGGKKGGPAHVSKPGEPPRWHTRPGLKNFKFQVDIAPDGVSNASVVLAPVWTRKSRTAITHSPSGAHLLEFGGRVSMIEPEQTRYAGTGRYKGDAVIKPRPFLGPGSVKMQKFFKSLLQTTPFK